MIAHITGLNQELKDYILGLLKDHHRAHNFTIVYATHYPSELEDFADKVIVFSDEKVLVKS